LLLLQAISLQCTWVATSHCLLASECVSFVRQVVKWLLMLSVEARIECVWQYHNCIHFAAWSSVQPKLSWGRPWLEELLRHASGPANW
jgi:hypothetical protein